MRILRRVLLAVLIALNFSATNAYCDEWVPTLTPANTSTSPTFKGSSNGMLAGTASISKVNVHTLLYPGQHDQGPGALPAVVGSGSAGR